MPKGSDLLSQVVSNCGEIYTVYLCEFCERLMPYFDETIEEGYPEGFTHLIMEEEDKGALPLLEFVEYCEKNLKTIDQIMKEFRASKN